MHQDERRAPTPFSSDKRPINQPNERSDESLDRSQHELEQLRFYRMDPNAERATLRAQLESSDQQVTYYHQLCREQEATIKGLRSRLEEAAAEIATLRDELDVRASDETARRGSWLALLREEDAVKAGSAKRCRAPTVESASDEGYGPSEQTVAASEEQQDTTNRVLEVFLTFVSVTDSRIEERQTVYVRQQQPLRDALGPRVFEHFPTDAMAFVYKAQQIRDVGQTAAQLCLEDKSEVSVTWLEDVGLLTSGRDDARNA